MGAITFTSQAVPDSAGCFIIPDTPDEISFNAPTLPT